MQVLDQSKATYFQDDQDLASQTFEYRAAAMCVFFPKTVVGASLISIWQHPFSFITSKKNGMFQMFSKHRCFMMLSYAYHMLYHALVVTFVCQGKISVWPSVFAAQCTNKPICLHLMKRCMPRHGRWFGCK